MFGGYGSKDTVSPRMVWTPASHGTGLTSAPLFLTGPEGINQVGRSGSREEGPFQPRLPGDPMSVEL